MSESSTIVFICPVCRLDSLTEVHRARQAELRKMEGDIESAKNSMETLEESSSEKHLGFYRSMSVFVHTLVECLQEKVSVEKISSKSIIFIVLYLIIIYSIVF